MSEESTKIKDQNWAKIAAILIPAIATAITAIYGAVRRPDINLQKISYETISEKLNKYDDKLDRIEAKVAENEGYIQGLKDSHIINDIIPPAIVNPPPIVIQSKLTPIKRAVLTPVASSSISPSAPSAPVALKPLPKFDEIINKAK
jgi:hypothetical protein